MTAHGWFKRLPLAGLAALLALVSLGLAGPAAADEIRIGVLLPFTGPWAKNGQESFVAMEIARDMINERGGINGKKIVFVKGDAVNPNAGISEAERLVSKEGVRLITGTYASPLGVAISTAAERLGVIHWETIAAADIMTRRGYKNLFQAGPAASRYGHAAVDFTRDTLAGALKKDVKQLRVALLWENRAFGTAVGKGVRDRATEAGIKLIYDEGYDQFMTDMTPLVQKLKDVKPDVLIAISFINDTVLFQRKAKELNFYLPAMIGVSAGYSVPDLRDSIGKTVNGIFVSDLPARVSNDALAPETRKAADEFFARYEKIQKRVAAGHATASFAGLWVLFRDVLPKAPSMEPADVRKVALALNLPDGHMINGGGVKFTNLDVPADPKDAGQNVRSSIGVWQWQEGGARQVYPSKLATHKVTLVPLPEWSQR